MTAHDKVNSGHRLWPPQPSGPEPGVPADHLAYSVDEAARLTGLSRDLLYDEMRRGGGKDRGRGRSVR